MKKLLSVIFILVSVHAYSQSTFTGANECRIRILTDKKHYECITRQLEARINNSLERFEFVIPVESICALNDSSDLAFIRRLAEGSSAIRINAELPGNQIDFSFLKTKPTTNLPGELVIGKLHFEEDVAFGGSMPADKLYFNFRFYLREGNRSLAQIDNENIIEIELAARGDKMVGLTSN
jgi:hypothetical protein